MLLNVKNGICQAWRWLRGEESFAAKPDSLSLSSNTHTHTHTHTHTQDPHKKINVIIFFFQRTISSLRVSYNMPSSYSGCPTLPGFTLLPYLLNVVSRSPCAAQIFLDVWSPTGKW
jgi:hypothetical protein